MDDRGVNPDERRMDPEEASANVFDASVDLSKYDFSQHAADRILENLARSPALDAAQQIARMQTDRVEQLARQFVRMQADQNERLARRIYEDAYLQPLKRFQDTLAASVERRYMDLAQNLTASAQLAAVNAANQALNSSLQHWTRASDLLAQKSLEHLLETAAQLATSPSVQVLLRRGHELSAAPPEATLEDLRTPSSDVLDGFADLEWVFELDRDSLLFLVKVLFHLTAVLGPATGMAIALSDGKLDAVDTPSVLAALYMLLGYALMALAKKDEDGEG